MNSLKQKYLSIFYNTIFVLDIEHLPQEMRNRFTEMREMDLQVESMLLVL